MEGTTAATPTNFIYAIVKQNNSESLKLVSMPCRLTHTPTNAELRKFHNYALSLGCAYCSCLESLTDKECMTDIEWRRDAIAWKDTYEMLNREYIPVAYSHRYGGWTGIDWKFNDDISFHISTNFGYGCSSYFYLVVRYKDVVLTPYEDYIRYRYAEAGQLIRYTESYRLEDSAWKTLMEEALAFYNAVVYQKDMYVFGWITRHLENMTSGIEKLRTALSVRFDNHCGGKDEAITGNELTLVKANKIANSLDFIENIRTLPVQVNPEQYANRLLAVCRCYLPELAQLISNLSAEESCLKNEIADLKQDNDYQLYARLRAKYYSKRKWYEHKEKRGMLRFLLSLLHRTMPSASLDVVRERIAALKLRLAEIEKRERKLSGISSTIRNLATCHEKIDTFLNKEASAIA